MARISGKNCGACVLPGSMGLQESIPRRKPNQLKKLVALPCYGLENQRLHIGTKIVQTQVS